MSVLLRLLPPRLAVRLFVVLLALPTWIGRLRAWLPPRPVA